jgi:hypothetical protein
MSLASARSSGGDSYEILIALRWAIQLLHNPDFLRVAVDSTDLDPSGQPIEVDDVVIYSRSGPITYCQCKENQCDFKPWKVADLADDLKKAATQLVRDRLGQVFFFSSTEFGELAKLAKHARAYTDAAAYRHSLTENMTQARIAATLDDCWAACLAGSGLETFDLLRRITFESTASQGSLREELLGLLRPHVTRAEAVYDALVGRLSRIKSRTTEGSGAMLPPSSLDREALLGLLKEAGAVLTPPRAKADLLREFRVASQVGRHWNRNIGNKRLPRRALEEALAHVQAQNPRILVTDGPGSGKTCLLLDLLDRLEADPTRPVLFIQGRIYAEARDHEARIAMGLPRNILDSVARMAEYRPVVVVLDSLDVLSLAREHQVLDFFLSLLDRLALIPSVTVVAACRDYDLKYDHRLAHRDWDQVVRLGLLDWQSEVMPLLAEWGVNATDLSEALTQLLCNPRMLAIFEEIVRRSTVPQASTSQELTERYLGAVVLRDPHLGEDAMNHLERMGRDMLARRKLSLPERGANLPEAMRQALLSAGVLLESGHRNLCFSHQTLLDVLAVRAAQSAGETLLEFIRRQPATPFVRPSVRSYFFYLRAVDPDGFRAQVRAVLDADGVAFHLKRLIAESLAEIEPEEADWRLIRHLFRERSELFPSFFFATRLLVWYGFFKRHWWPLLLESQDADWVLHHVRHMEVWLEAMPESIVANWLEILEVDWLPAERVASDIAFALHRFKAWTTPDLRTLFEKLLQFPHVKHDFLADRLAQWVDATESGDDLLWHYIVRDITPDDVHKFRLDHKLHCEPHEFGNDRDFLERRMKRSESLLESAIAAVEAWSDADSRTACGFTTAFLRGTSYGKTHSRGNDRHVDAEAFLLRAIEATCLEHARADSMWWRNRESRLRQSHDAALRYIALLAYTECPAANLEGIRAVLLDKGILEYSWHYELGQVIHAAFYLLDESTQDKLTDLILELRADRDSQDGHPVPWMVMARRDLLAAIPGHLLSPAADAYLLDACQRYGEPEREPHIESWSGRVTAPFGSEQFIEATDEGVVRLLDHYKAENRGRWEHESHVGGREEVGWQLSVAASHLPSRFLPLLTHQWGWLDEYFRVSLLSGVSKYLRCRFGGLTDNNWSPLETLAGPELAGQLLGELDTHPDFWRGRRETADALQACAHVVESNTHAETIVFHLIGMLAAVEPKEERESGLGLVHVAINSTRGVAAEAALILADHWLEAGRSFPETLPATLCRFADDPHPAVRAVLLRRLPFLQDRMPELGWRVFDLATEAGDAAIWAEAERCLYYAYHRHYELVAPYLARMFTAGAYEPWGRISALACLSGQIALPDFLDSLLGVADGAAWKGAAQVFASNVGQHRESCLNALIWMLERSPEQADVAEEAGHLFDGKAPIRGLPAVFFQCYFAAKAQKDTAQPRSLFQFFEWLAAIAPDSTDEALVALETLFASPVSASFERWELRDMSVLNHLFGEAEDREQADGGAFLARVIAVQDALLQSGTHGFDQWLKDAERP